MKQQCEELKLISKIKEAIYKNLDCQNWKDCVQEYPIFKSETIVRDYLYSFRTWKEKGFPPTFLQWIKKLKDAKEKFKAIRPEDVKHQTITTAEGLAIEWKLTTANLEDFYFPEMTASCVISDLPYGLEMASWDTKEWLDPQFVVPFLEKLIGAVAQSNNCAAWTWIFFCNVKQLPFLEKILESRGITYDYYYWVKEGKQNQPGLRYTNVVVQLS